jgi:hypothetical protein
VLAGLVYAKVDLVSLILRGGAIRRLLRAWRPGGLAIIGRRLTNRFRYASLAFGIKMLVRYRS